MADFMIDLWTSVFTPGPTPTLLIATNVTFAALLALLLALLFATASIHFAVLAVLAVGLWASVNWFAAEVMRVRALEQDKPEMVDKTTGPREATAEAGMLQEQSRGVPVVEAEELTPRRVVDVDVGARQGESWNTSAAARVAPHGLRTRRAMAESTGSLSTDSEWEKVEDDEEAKMA